MESVKIEVEDRAEVGTRACRRLRNKGRLPVNLYGLERPVRALSVDMHTLGLLLDRGQTVVELTLGSDSQAALVRDVQYDPTGQTLIHADLVRIDRDTPVHVNVPIRFVGTAPSVAGSIIEKQMDHIPLEILPLEIPKEFVVNLGRLPVGETFTIGELTLPPSAKPYGVHAEDVVVVNHIHVEREETTEGEESTEPEVIGKSKDDSED